MEVRASTIAEYLDGELVGPDAVVTGVDSLEGATDGELSFRTPGYEYAVADSDAGAVICPPDTPELPGRTLIRVESPRAGFARAGERFFRKGVEETTIHPTAVVEGGAEIGERTYVGANVYLGESVTVGDDCSILAGCVLGTEGAGHTWDEEGRIPSFVHEGDIIIEDEVVVRPNCVVQRATFDETVVGRHTSVGDLCTIGHNATIGAETWIGQSSVVNGSVELGERVEIHPNVSIGSHRTVGDRATVGMNSTVMDDIPAGATVVGSPARPTDS